MGLYKHSEDSNLKQFVENKCTEKRLKLLNRDPSMNNYAAAELRCTQMYMTNEERTMANSGAAVGRTQQDLYLHAE